MSISNKHSYKAFAKDPFTSLFHCIKNLGRCTRYKTTRGTGFLFFRADNYTDMNANFY